MSSSNRLALGTGGRLVVVKEAAPGPASDRLRREAEVLRQAAHPGVVQLIDMAEHDDGGAALTTAFVAGGTLADGADHLDPPGLARILADLASTLADLHDRGIFHGRLGADHVLVGGDQAGPALCGLAESRVPEDSSPAGPTAADDVEALRTLVADVAASGDGAVADALGQVARRACSPHPTGRPTMRALAASLAAVVTGESPVGEASGGAARPLPPRRRPASSRRPMPRGLALSGTALAGGVVAVALAITGGGSPTSGSDDRHAAGADGGLPAGAPTETSASPPVPASSTTAPPPPTTEAPVRVFPRPECPPATPPVADPDGDGCADAVQVSAGVVAVAGVRWRVADADDLVVIGDWDCDEVATPAVVRPASGQVWAFARWAEDGEAVVAEAVEAVPGPVASATVVSGPEGPDNRRCDAIEVVAGGGDHHVVEPDA